jgi:hypothetical protein
MKNSNTTDTIDTWTRRGFYHAFTIQPPWGSLIARGRKTIETRTHRRFKCLTGRRVALHQGKLLDRACVRTMQEVGIIPTLDDLAHAKRFAGAVVAVVTISQTAWLVDDDPWPNAFACCRCGPHLYGYDLTDVQPLEKPVYLQGQQGIFFVTKSSVDSLLLPPIPFIPHETVKGGTVG